VRLEDFPEPSVVGEARVAGLDFNRTRTLQLARAVLALSVMPKASLPRSLPIMFGGKR
jgi:hypothetical protein